MSKQNHLTVIEQLKRGDEKTIHKIYVDYKNGFSLFANKYDLSADDLLDVYQDSIIALCENAKKGTIDNLESSLSTYLFSIGKYMIYRRLKAQNKRISIDYDNQLPQVIEDEYEEVYDEDKTILLQENFKKLGEQCQKVLRLFYYEEKKLDEIQIELKYTNKDVLKSQKSRCLKQLKDLIKK
jgi:RNA polymerase sigma factor (sigma-70 family)